MSLAKRLPLAAALALALAVPASAQTEGIGYRLSPTATYVFFDDDAALDDGLLYGGGVGVSFGEFFELGGTYLLGQNFGTDFSNLSGLEGNPELAGAVGLLPTREVDLQRYGAELRVNLGSGVLFPFVRLGTGILRFDPEDLDATRNIYLLGGAGLQLTGADRYALSVAVEDLAYRYNPATTFFTEGELTDAGLGSENFNQATVQNLALRAALQLYLGGRRPGSLSPLDREFQRQFSGGLSGLSLVLEPFYGRVNFDEAFAYRDQSFLGGELGFDLGPLVGLRGFYARGVEDGDPTSFQAIQMLGGDVRFRLSEGSGLVPFLSVGGGYLDVLDGYADDADAEPENAMAQSRPFATGGGGVELLLSPRLRAVGEARALLMSAEDVDNLSQPDNVFLSPFFKGGLSVGLGGSAGGEVQAVRRETLEAERARFEAELAAQERAAAEREAELLGELRAQEADLEEQIAEARAEGDSLAVARLQVQRDRIRADARTSEAALADRAAGPAPLGGGAVRTAQGERIITIPLPEQGELYVRYGDPGGVQIESAYDGTAAAPAAQAAPVSQMSEAELRELVRRTLREALADRAATGQAVTPADVAEIERRVEDRIADRIGGQLRDDDGVSAADLARIESRLEDRMRDEIRELRELLLLQQQNLRDDRRPAPVIIDRDGDVIDDGEVIDEDDRVVRRPVVETVSAYEPASFALAPTGGLAFGKGPESALVGLHGEYATGAAYRYIPEILIGVGSRRSFVANLDVAFGLPSAYGIGQYGSPYVRTGVGLVNYAGEDEPADSFDDVDDGGTSLAFNLGVGATLNYGDGRFFVDFSSGNLGRFNRLTAGYRFPFGRTAY